MPTSGGVARLWSNLAQRIVHSDRLMCDARFPALRKSSRHNPESPPSWIVPLRIVCVRSLRAPHMLQVGSPRVCPPAARTFERMSGMDAATWAGVGAFIIEALTVVVAPAAALIGALGGAAVANKRAALRDREQRAEARRDAARGLMVELLHSGNAWVIKLQYSSMGAILDSYAQEPKKENPVTQEAVAELRALRSRLEMAFTDILLRVEEPVLRSVIEHCRAEMDRSREVTSTLDKQIRERDTPALRPIYDYVQAFRAELRTMEQAAIPYFAAPIQ